MKYEEAWRELLEKLKYAEKQLSELAMAEGTVGYNRLDGKSEGLKLAAEYMREIEASID
jgi:hypothetical protein